MLPPPTPASHTQGNWGTEDSSAFKGKVRHKQSQDSLVSVMSDTKAHGSNQNPVPLHQGLGVAGEDSGLHGKKWGGC